MKGMKPRLRAENADIPGNIDAPGWLSEEARKDWDRVLPILTERRILTVADVFEAMTAHRQYRPSLGSEAALSELRSNVGIKYDKDGVSVLEHLLVQADNQELMDLIGE